MHVCACFESEKDLREKNSEVTRLPLPEQWHISLGYVPILVSVVPPYSTDLSEIVLLTIVCGLASASSI